MKISTVGDTNPMTATYRKSGDNFLPVIKHSDGRRETLYGSPLATIKTAKKYARFEIYNRKL